MTRPNFHLGHLVGGVGGRPIGRKLPNFQGTAAISATFFGFWGWRGGREASLLMWRQLSARFLSQVGHATARNDLSLVILTPPLPCTTASTQPVEENRGNGRHHHPSPASPKPPRNYETYINLVKKRLNLTTQSRGKWEPRRGIKNTKKVEDNIFASLPRLQLMAVKPNPWKQRPLPYLDSQHSQHSRVFR